MSEQAQGNDTAWFRIRRLVHHFTVSLWLARGIASKWAMLRCLIGWLRVRIGWPAASREVTLRLEDFRVTLDASRGEIASYWEIWHESGYEDAPGFRAAEDACIVDVGGNVGFFTLRQACRAMRGRVVTFEPSPSVYNRLARNVAMNGLENVTLIHAAVGAERGTVRLLETPSSINSRVVSETDSHGVDVECVTLDETMERMLITRIDILKIDTEGHERAVLAGALRTLPHVRRMVLELHGDIDLEKRAVDALVEPLGFRTVASNRSLFYYDRLNPPKSSR